MDTKLRKTILEFLYKKKKKTVPYQVEAYCLSVYEVHEKDFEKISEMDSKINHLIDVLAGEGLVGVEEYQMGQLTGTYVWLTAEGYKEFNPWYLKMWSFVKGDFQAVLTVISTLLGITGTILGWIALTKK